MPEEPISLKYLTGKSNLYLPKKFWFSNHLNPLTQTLARKPAFFYVTVKQGELLPDSY